MAKIRLNIQIDENMKQYCIEQSEALGISLSGFVNVAIAQYKQQQEAIKMASNFTPLMEKIEQLQIKIKEQQQG